MAEKDTLLADGSTYNSGGSYVNGVRQDPSTPGPAPASDGGPTMPVASQTPSTSIPAPSANVQVPPPQAPMSSSDYYMNKAGDAFDRSIQDNNNSFGKSLGAAGSFLANVGKAGLAWVGQNGRELAHDIGEGFSGPSDQGSVPLSTAQRLATAVRGGSSSLQYQAPPADSYSDPMRDPGVKDVKWTGLGDQTAKQVFDAKNVSKNYDSKGNATGSSSLNANSPLVQAGKSPSGIGNDDLAKYGAGMGINKMNAGNTLDQWNQNNDVYTMAVRSDANHQAAMNTSAEALLQGNLKQAQMFGTGKSAKEAADKLAAFQAGRGQEYAPIQNAYKGTSDMTEKQMNQSHTDSINPVLHMKALYERAGQGDPTAIAELGERAKDMPLTNDLRRDGSTGNITEQKTVGPARATQATQVPPALDTKTPLGGNSAFVARINTLPKAGPERVKAIQAIREEFKWHPGLEAAMKSVK